MINISFYLIYVYILSQIWSGIRKKAHKEFSLILHSAFYLSPLYHCLTAHLISFLWHPIQVDDRAHSKDYFEDSFLCINAMLEKLIGGNVTFRFKCKVKHCCWGEVGGSRWALLLQSWTMTLWKKQNSFTLLQKED